MRQPSDSAAILDNCIERLRQGQSIADCLHAYPDHAAELAPMLAAAQHLQLLSHQQLSPARRARARARLRRALASPPQRPPTPSWLGTLGRSRGLALAAMLSLVFLIALGSAAAASQPGDLAYPLRVQAERWPALLATRPLARADAELATAERRLAELGTYLPKASRPDLTALDAAMHGLEAAAASAASLPGPQRQAVAAQLSLQAQTMARLATGDAASQARLQLAARWSLAIAARLRAGQGPHGRWPDVEHLLPTPGGPPSPVPAPGPGPTTPTPLPTAARPGLIVTPTAAPPPARRTAAPAATPMRPTLAPRPSEPAGSPGPGVPPTARPVPPTPSGPEPGPDVGPGGQPTDPPASSPPPPAPTANPQPPAGPPGQPAPPGQPTPGPDQGSPGPGPGPGKPSP